MTHHATPNVQNCSPIHMDSWDLGLSLVLQNSKPCNVSSGTIFFQIQELTSLVWKSTIIPYTHSPETEEWYKNRVFQQIKIEACIDMEFYD